MSRQGWGKSRCLGGAGPRADVQIELGQEQVPDGAGSRAGVGRAGGRADVDVGLGQDPVPGYGLCESSCLGVI